MNEYLFVVHNITQQTVKFFLNLLCSWTPWLLLSQPQIGRNHVFVSLWKKQQVDMSNLLVNSNEVWNVKAPTNCNVFRKELQAILIFRSFLDHFRCLGAFWIPLSVYKCYVTCKVTLGSVSVIFNHYSRACSNIFRVLTHSNARRYLDCQRYCSVFGK